MLEGSGCVGGGILVTAWLPSVVTDVCNVPKACRIVHACVWCVALQASNTARRMHMG